MDILEERIIKHEKYGEYSILYKTNEKTKHGKPLYKILFKNTGYECLYTMSLINAKKVSDKSISKNDIVGETYHHKTYGSYKVINKINKKGVIYYTILFLTTEYKTEVRRDALLKGFVKDLEHKDSLIGTSHIHNKYGEYTVLEKTKTSLYKVKFKNTGYEYNTYKDKILKNTVKDSWYNSDTEILHKCFEHPIYGIYEVIEVCNYKPNYYKIRFKNTDTEKLYTKRNILSKKVTDVQLIDNMIGKVFNSNNYGEVLVIDRYKIKHKQLKYKIKFLNSGYVCLCTKNNILKGKIRDTTINIILKDGMELYSLHNGKFKILKIHNSLNIDIEFIETKTVKTVSSSSIKSGLIKDYNFKSVENIGFLGRPIKKEEIYLYKTWASMLRRCYNKNSKAYKFYGAKGVYVCKDWLCFSVFSQDVIELKGYNPELFNLPMDDKRKLQLDKDIIDRNAKIYSPQTCMWVSMEENIKESIKNRIK